MIDRGMASPFSCLSCSVVSVSVPNITEFSESNNKIGIISPSSLLYFTSSDQQRLHYKSEWHRYNLKRKLAELPPVSELEYLERMKSTLTNDNSCKDTKANKKTPNQNWFNCNLCKRSYSSLNSLNSHLKSKKHFSNANNSNTGNDDDDQVKTDEETISILEKRSVDEMKATTTKLMLSEDASMEEINQIISQNNRKLPESECFFCGHVLDTQSSISEDKHNINENLVGHLKQAHSFFIPDEEYLEDKNGLIQYLREKVGETFTCISCDAGFYSLEAVRNHMVSKGHFYIHYEVNSVSEIAGYYNFTPFNDDELENENENENTLFISPDESELILPSGAKLGHRSYRRYYKQYFRNINDSEGEKDHHDFERKSRRINSLISISQGQPLQTINQLVRDQRVARTKQTIQQFRVERKDLRKHFRHQLLQ